MRFKSNEDKIILCKKIAIHPTKEQIESIERDSFYVKNFITHICVKDLNIIIVMENQ